MALLKRKIDSFLLEWKKNEDRLPLIVKGARQVGKTKSIEFFAKNNYENFIEINFISEPYYKDIFNDGYEVDNIIKNISLINPNFKFIPHKTLIFFDEIQACIKATTALKFFKLDGRFDLICSGSLMGIKYQEIESISVGYKEDYVMYSLDFEEFLWAKGYKDEQIESLYKSMKEVKPLSQLEMKVYGNAFKEYMLIGGMPHVVDTFISQNNFSNTLNLQRQILLDYEEDITKYASGLGKGKILDFYLKIPVFLAQENKRFQITKIHKGARNREYIGVMEWLNNAGIINTCYAINSLSLPLKGNYNPNSYKVYFSDTGLLIASLDDEAQIDLRTNKNFNTYKGAIFENIVGDMLVKEGYQLYFYKNDRSNLEMDFFLRDKDSLVPLEVKANDNSTKSLNKLVDGDYEDIHYGIKVCNKNIGFNGKFYTFPYFLTFLLKRYLSEK